MGQPRRLVPQTRHLLKHGLTKFAKGLFRSHSSVLRNGPERVCPRSHTWLIVFLSIVQLQPYPHTKQRTASRRISINGILPVIPAMMPACSDFQPHRGVEDLAFPQGWQAHACKAAQRRRTCPDLRQIIVMVKTRIPRGQWVNHVVSFPKRDTH